MSPICLPQFQDLFHLFWVSLRQDGTMQQLEVITDMKVGFPKSSFPLQMMKQKCMGSKIRTFPLIHWSTQFSSVSITVWFNSRSKQKRFVQNSGEASLTPPFRDSWYFHGYFMTENHQQLFQVCLCGGELKLDNLGYLHRHGRSGQHLVPW